MMDLVIIIDVSLNNGRSDALSHQVKMMNLKNINLCWWFRKFTGFKIKIVSSGTDEANSTRFKDLRVIALAWFFLFYYFFICKSFTCHVCTGSTVGRWLGSMCCRYTWCKVSLVCYVSRQYLGEGFDWEDAPWFDANGLNDVAPMQAKTVVQKLQNNHDTSWGT